MTCGHVEGSSAHSLNISKTKVQVLLGEANTSGGGRHTTLNVIAIPTIFSM